jgi:hypothetical protein
MRFVAIYKDQGPLLERQSFSLFDQVSKAFDYQHEQIAVIAVPFDFVVKVAIEIPTAQEMEKKGAGCLACCMEIDL